LGFVKFPDNQKLLSTGTKALIEDFLSEDAAAPCHPLRSMRMLLAHAWYHEMGGGSVYSSGCHLAHFRSVRQN
jgi:hypothetical protein